MNTVQKISLLLLVFLAAPIYLCAQGVTAEKISLPSNTQKVLDIEEIGSKQIWVGTDKGLLIVAPNKESKIIADKSEKNKYYVLDKTHQL